jgi:hypothetical protein
MAGRKRDLQQVGVTGVRSLRAMDMCLPFLKVNVSVRALQRALLYVLFSAALLTTGGLPCQAEQALPGGTITVVYDEPSNPDYLPIAQALADNGIYDRLSLGLSEAFILPQDITLRFTELDEVNAYWDPSNNEITVGYELIDTYSKLFDVDPDDPAAMEQEYIDAAFFTVLHEFGHALVALLELPITGREEDAVDEFATVFLLQMDDPLAEAALVSAIEQFAADSEDAELSESAFADEHSLDKQRFYAVLYLVHGSDPERYQNLVDEGLLPEDKAEYSAAEFERKTAVWDALLSDHIR